MRLIYVCMRGGGGDGLESVSKRTHIDKTLIAKVLLLLLGEGSDERGDCRTGEFLESMVISKALIGRVCASVDHRDG